ncbi:glycoside hydrolase family 3 N-terminal domain-containing protein [Alistipes sp.]|uniref:beta-glucosidase family protein n=1 Tax=Alistipes sp. TaxID=1872444 RepID=UPI0025C14A48|nr:glycoside hydrolase family 3 N-terminal domain-containing protein [Alistipes sp.]
MSLEEKASLLVGTSMENYGGQGAVTGRTLKIVPGSAGATCSLETYGIPPTVMADGPAGLRIDPRRANDPKTYFCTAFPIGTMLASTWNEEVIERCGAAMGREVLDYGCDVILGPGINIHRHPLCGRNFEYYSEDPLLSGKCGAAMVRGIQSQGVGTSVKHFAANNQESMRLQNDVRISQRALREIYLRGFEIAVKEGRPWTVMSSYNRINGPYTQENRDLLTTILRDEWGYKGIVISDWIGKRNTAAQVHAGNDLMMPGEPAQSEEIVDAVRSGKLSEADVDKSVVRVLEYILQTPRFRACAVSEAPDLEAHAAVSRQVAAEGMVLLRNEGATLPLSAGCDLSVFGVNAYDCIAGGTGAGHVNKAYTVNLDEGLHNAGFRLNDRTADLYAKYMSFGQALLCEQNALRLLGEKWFVPETTLTPEFIASRARESDAAIIAFGRNSGEYNDRPTSDFYLTNAERVLLESVCSAFHAAGKKVIVVLNIGGVIETNSWKELPDAILLAWQGGLEAGNATADVLSGRAAPSGRLPMTFPIDYSDHPSSKNFPLDYRGRRGDWADDAPERNVRNLGFTCYEEDIWVGYRYFSTYAREKVSYPFGYGLSYTTFDWTDAAIRRSGAGYEVTLRVTNTGLHSGRDVAELYIAAPKSALIKPVRELRSFAKSRELQPGESQTLKLWFAASDLASFDEQASAFIVEAGDYTAELGRSADEIILRLPFTAKSSERKVHDVLRPQKPLQLLKF